MTGHVLEHHPSPGAYLIAAKAFGACLVEATFGTLVARLPVTVTP